MTIDPLLDAFWTRGLILLGNRVQEEYGLNTPIFIDLRHGLYEDLDLLLELGKALHGKIIELSTDSCREQQVVGIPDTATPLALATAMASRNTSHPLSYGQLRKRPASYPGGLSGSSAYMGVCNPQREITLIDDVVASGATKLWSSRYLNEANLEVARILVVVDREQGGRGVLEEKGFSVHCLYCISDIVLYYQQQGIVDEETARTALKHIERNQFTGPT